MRTASDLVRVPLVALAAFALGVLTAYAQGWLPHQIGSIANSAGPWALVAFGLALFGSRRWAAAAFGFLALAALLVGYVAGVEQRGDTAGATLLLFWGAAAVVVGPPLGVSAYWLRSGRGVLAAVGIGAIAGVLIGEGIYSVVYVSDTTYTPYWWCEILLGVTLLALVCGRRLGDIRAISVAAFAALVVSAAFVGVYHQDLISVLP